MIRVVFVDDDARLRESWARMLAANKDIELVATLDRADDLAERAAQLKPDIVVLDLTMPGKDPLQACREVSTRTPATRVIIYSGLDDSALMDSAYDAGAWAFVDKLSPPDTIIAVVRSVVGGTPVFPNRATPFRK